VVFYVVLLQTFLEGNLRNKTFYKILKENQIFLLITKAFHMGISLFKEEHNAHNHKQFDHELDHEIANLNLDKHFLEANRLIYLENSNIETKNDSDEDLVNINLNDIFN
jgi:hypothetical protein